MATNAVAASIDYFGDSVNALGESPVWDAARQLLWWVDIKAQKICAAGMDGHRTVDWHYAQPVGSIALATDGLVAALTDGFYRINPESGAAAMIAPVPLPGPDLRFNDGKTDRAGRFISGHMRSAGDTDGELWRLDRDGSAEKLLDGIGIANATCFSPDGAWMYFADSLEGMLRRYPYDQTSGRLGAREDLVDCREHGSPPDGATVDAHGNIWAALVLAQRIACFAPDGVLLRTIDLPIPFPSCPAFGGERLDTLFVTTIADSGHRLVSDHPDAGRIIAITGLDAVGIAETPYQPSSERLGAPRLGREYA